MAGGSLSHPTRVYPSWHIKLSKSDISDFDWERVGVRGHGLSIDRNPSPGSHLTMRSDLSHKGRGRTEHVEPKVSKFIYQTLETFGDRLPPPEKTPLPFQLLLQFFHLDITPHRVAIERQCRRRSRGLAHRKARAGNPRRRLAVMGHRGAAPGHQ